jgi:tRNA threonylcarbamoyl adenosine modification protein (Sua5/YciO/YrdC/YwlC family)
MLLPINAQDPQLRLLHRVVEYLKQGGVIAYPTDTVYGIGCDIFNKKGIKKIHQIKQRDPRKPFSFICSDLSEVSNYAQVSNFAFKLMKRHLPGPYTFVLEATRVVPDLLVTRQKTVGIRIPDNPIALGIVRELGHPLVTTSANVAGEGAIQDARDIQEQLGKMLDCVVDGGLLTGEPSTVISLVNDQPEVLRLGSGPIDWLED